MVRLEALALAALAFALAIAAWAPATSAGTAAAPEITDPAGDQTLAGVVPVDPAAGSSSDIVAGWITEDAANLYFNIQLTGSGASGTGGAYTWNFHVTAGADSVEMSATSGASPTPGGAATAATLDASVVTLTVPRTAFGAATVLTDIHIESSGGTPLPDPLVIADLAPDAGPDAHLSYTITGGGAAGGSGGGAGAKPGDKDGDGLNDTWEVKYFGNTTKQNGTGDPDKEGLNNTAEQKLGTDPTKADTDADGLNDREDAFPLDPHRPGLKDPGNTTDSDKDGLPDAWEREHFGNLNQTGAGDPDKDSFNNTAEHQAGSDPLKADTDGDGVPDATDEFPLDPLRSSDEPSTHAKPEIYAGAGMFAVTATFCLFGLARRI